MKSFRCSLTFFSSLEPFNNTLLKFSRLPQTDPSVPFQLLEIKVTDSSSISLPAPTPALIIHHCLTKQPKTYWLIQQQSFTLFTSLQFDQGSVWTICLLPMPYQPWERDWSWASHFQHFSPNGWKTGVLCLFSVLVWAPSQNGDYIPRNVVSPWSAVEQGLAQIDAWL